MAKLLGYEIWQGGGFLDMEKWLIFVVTHHIKFPIPEGVSVKAKFSKNRPTDSNF